MRALSSSCAPSSRIPKHQHKHTWAALPNRTAHNFEWLRRKKPQVVEEPARRTRVPQVPAPSARRVLWCSSDETVSKPSGLLSALYATERERPAPLGMGCLRSPQRRVVPAQGAAGGRRVSEEDPGAPGSRAFGATRTLVRERRNKREDGVPGSSAESSSSGVRRTPEQPSR